MMLVVEGDPRSRSGDKHGVRWDVRIKMRKAEYYSYVVMSLQTFQTN